MTSSLEELEQLIKENADLYISYSMNSNMWVDSYCYKDGTVFDVFINRDNNKVCQINISD